jgi:hypothetical protein
MDHCETKNKNVVMHIILQSVYATVVLSFSFLLGNAFQVRSTRVDYTVLTYRGVHASANSRYITSKD